MVQQLNSLLTLTLLTLNTSNDTIKRISKYHISQFTYNRSLQDFPFFYLGTWTTVCIVNFSFHYATRALTQVVKHWVWMHLYIRMTHHNTCLYSFWSSLNTRKLTCFEKEERTRLLIITCSLFYSVHTYRVNNFFGIHSWSIF